MATLTYNPKIGTWWTGTVNINYTTSYNSLTNQTTVTFSGCSVAYFGRNKYGSHSDSTITVTAADNTSSSGTASFSTDGETNGGTKTFTGTPSPTTITVQHAASAGAKSVTIAGSTTIKVYATSTATSQSTASGSGSVSVTTGTYAPASSVTCSTADIGSAPTIQISRNSTSFTHTLTYEFGSLSGTIATKTTSTTITSWKFPTSFYSQIPNAKSGIGTITCKTYSGDTLLGTKTCSFTATTNESLCKPTLSPTVEDSNSIAIGVTGNKNTLIIYFSDAAITTGAAARNSATLVSQKVTCGSKSITTSSGTIEDVESGTFTFTATDSRGYSTTQTITKDIINYVNPTCNLNISNPSTDGSLSFTITGNYFNSSFGAVNNTLSVYYKYKTSGGTYSDNIEATNITLNNNTYTATINLTGLDYKETYTFQALTIDKIKSANSAERVIKTTPIFSWSNSDFEFNVPVKFSGKTLFDIVYPVGAIYMSASSTSPASLFGGTWEQIQDRFLLAAGSSYAAGNTGGAEKVTLTEAQLPYIEGTLIFHGQENGTCIYQTSGHFTGTQLDGKYKDGGNTVSSAYSQQNPKFSFGSGESHTNMPPYLAVYVWKRTA